MMLRFADVVDSQVGVMAGKSPVTAGVDERLALEALAASRERGEADRARALLLTLAGWTSARIGEAFASAKTRCGCGAATMRAVVLLRCGRGWRRVQPR